VIHLVLEHGPEVHAVAELGLLVLDHFLHEVENDLSILAIFFLVTTFHWSLVHLNSSVLWSYHTILSNLTGNADLQKMVGKLVMFFDLLDGVSNNGSLLFENPDASIDLNIDVHLLLEILERCWNLVLSLLVEDDFV
jgi:hypothetical protein